jgi:hypothetical protein
MDLFGAERFRHRMSSLHIVLVGRSPLGIFEELRRITAPACIWVISLNLLLVDVLHVSPPCWVGIKPLIAIIAPMNFFHLHKILL